MRLFRRPSPAFIVAMVALIAALGGTAIAAKVLTTKKVKKISRNIADQEITKQAPNLSVKSAATINGFSKINYQANTNAGSQQVFSGGGLTLTANCGATTATLNATTSVPPATLQSYGNGSDTNTTTFTTTQTLLTSNEERDFVFTAGNGAIVVGQLAAGFNAGGLYGGTTPNCLVKGYVQVL